MERDQESPARMLIPRNELSAVVLPSLNTALAAFHDSPYAICNVLIFFTRLAYLAHDCAESHSDPQDGWVETHWQVLLQSIQDPYENDCYRDPESHQAVQVIRKRVRPVTAVRELQENLGKLNMGSLPRDAMFAKGHGYSEVPRTFAWLAMCAMHWSLDLPDQTRGYLERFLVHQPRAIWPTVHLDLRSAGAPPSLFGLDGSMTNALNFFQNRTFVDVEAILWILRVVLRETMNVADTWNHVMHVVGKDRSPSYRWYHSAFRNSQWCFQHMVSDPFIGVPYRVRDRLKDVPLLALWDSLWNEALNIFEAWDTTRGQFGYHLYKWVLKSAMQLDTDRSGTIRQIIKQNFKCHWLAGTGGKYKVPVQFRPEGFDVAIELADIERMSEQRYLDNGIGWYFYGDELDDAPQGIEPEEWELEGTPPPQHFLEPVQTVPSGIPIVIEKFISYAVSPLGDATCTVCLHGFQNGETIENRCCELKECLHLFHRHCIYDWVNGTAFNSNQCPNCRTEIFPEELRRKLRVEGQENEEPEDEEDAQRNVESQQTQRRFVVRRNERTLLDNVIHTWGQNDGIQ